MQMRERPPDAHGWEDGEESEPLPVQFSMISKTDIDQLSNYMATKRIMEEYILQSFGIPAHLVNPEWNQKLTS